MSESYAGPPVDLPDRSEIIAFVLGIVPFVCNFTTSSTTTVNGRVTSSSSTDFVALALGAVVIVMAFNSFRLLGRTPDSDKMKRYAIIAGLIALGIFQLLRGFGMIDFP